MIKTLSTILLSISIMACNNESSADNSNAATTDSDTTKVVAVVADNALTDEEKKDGWQLLFDGVSTKGWHKYGETTIGSAWKIVDGQLHLDASQKENWQIKDGGDIVSDSSFGDFHLALDWKIDTAGNSGIIFYIHEDKKKYEWPWQTGPEMQVLDNAKHPDAKINKHRAGDLYDLISSSKETVKPALEWNHAEIISKGGKLDLFLNGENVVSTTVWDDNWKNLVAGSKFKSVPDFGTYKEGKIGLQDHGNNVWFKNIKIKRL